MPAAPSDIAKITSNGVVISTDATEGAAIKALHADAQPTGDPGEIEMFFVNPAHAQILLNERWAKQKVAGGSHLGIEIESSIGIGTTTPIYPTIPGIRAVDASLGRDEVLRLRMFAQSMETDRYSLELLA